jgi:hypothetical protein
MHAEGRTYTSCERRYCLNPFELQIRHSQGRHTPGGGVHPDPQEAGSWPPHAHSATITALPTRGPSKCPNQSFAVQHGIARPIGRFTIAGLDPAHGRCPSPKPAVWDPAHQQGPISSLSQIFHWRHWRLVSLASENCAARLGWKAPECRVHVLSDSHVDQVVLPGCVTDAILH